MAGSATAWWIRKRRRESELRTSYVKLPAGRPTDPPAGVMGRSRISEPRTSGHCVELAYAEEMVASSPESASAGSIASRSSRSPRSCSRANMDRSGSVARRCTMPSVRRTLW